MGTFIKNSILFLLVEEFAETFTKQVVNLPVAEESVVRVKQLKLLFIISIVFFGPFVAYSL